MQNNFGFTDRSNSLKASVKNMRGSVEKISPKESFEGAHSVLRGSLRAPKRFFKGQIRGCKTEGAQP